MTTFGYALSSEEHTPRQLIDNAARCEAAGFQFALISDHFHPWINHQGNSGFVWATLGGIAEATSSLRVGTGVTCPIIRIHPAIIAQAAATVATLFEGRFFLGVGAGENLNEHILGHRWPRSDERQAMLVEAVEIIQELWKGQTVSHFGDCYTVDEARIFNLPKQLPDIYIAASGPDAAEIAAEIGDGMIGVAPDDELVRSFKKAGGNAECTYGQVTICYADSLDDAEQTVAEWWPTAGLSGDLSWEVKTPELFEAACKSLDVSQMVSNISCGPDVELHVENIRKFADAGYSHVYIHQVGPNQPAFFDYYERELESALKQL